MNSKLQPAIMAGAALGVVLVVIAVVSALVPALGVLGCCACLLPIGAGLWAAQGAIGKSESPVQLGDGALLGAVAGAVGGLIYLDVGVPLGYFTNASAIAAQMEQLRQAGLAIPLAGFALALVVGIICVVVYIILGVIGGLIGVAAFEKRKGDAGAAPPPPPPDFGGGQTGGGTYGGFGS